MSGALELFAVLSPQNAGQRVGGLTNASHWLVDGPFGDVRDPWEDIGHRLRDGDEVAAIEVSGSSGRAAR